jgi:hypothetical protein
MSKIILGLIVTSIVLVPIIYKNKKTLPPERVSYDFKQMWGHNASIYKVQLGRGSFCYIAAQKNERRRTSVQAESSCAHVYNGLERIETLIFGEKGISFLKDKNNQTIMTLMPSDGFSFEAVTISGDQVSLTLL